MKQPTKAQERYIKDLAARLDDGRSHDIIAREMIGEAGRDIRRDRQAASQFIEALIEQVGE